MRPPSELDADSLVGHLYCRVARRAYVPCACASRTGGGFGLKVNVYPEEVLRLCQSHAGRPYAGSRTALSTDASAHARDQLHHVDVAFDTDGRITAIRDRFVLDSGVACPYPLSSAYNVSSHFRTMYKIPNISVDGECVLTHMMFNLPYRGAGRPEAAFVMRDAAPLRGGAR